ncbi:MAG TPA: M23 family metallopeptidase [Candidatus Polarisedimenticolaceae bacterium]|nr:M23 family metallopeptidase [Candidatus Polarisedimenticolaceae bacterium]
MRRRFYTIFILPHAHARFRKLHLSRNFVAVSFGVLALGLIGGGLAPHLLFKVQAQSVVLSDLEAENRALRDHRDRFDTALEQMAQRLDQVESEASRLARELGVKDLPTARPAAGGALVTYKENDPRVVDEEIQALGNRLQALDLSFDTIDQAWQERAKVLACTPSLLPVSGFFSDGFGWRKDPITGQRAFHEGMDIVAETGSPVRAPADGIVVAAGRNSSYGKAVDLSHGYGLASRFGHLSAILVRPGDKVKRGDVIGRVGSTGRSTGPHLHYEVFKEGRQVNPRRYLPNAQD